MIDATFVQKVTDLSQVQEFVVADNNGKNHNYTSKPVHEVKPAPLPLPSGVTVKTLVGFGELVTEKIEGMNPDDYLIQVEDETTVTLKMRTCDEHGRRIVLVTAKPVSFE